MERIDRHGRLGLPDKLLEEVRFFVSGASLSESRNHHRVAA